MDGGHAGTGLSIAQGLATARDLRHSMERIAVVVGDAALLSGLSLEALNDIGHRQTQLLIVLNDNEMSISPSVGALSKYLSEIKLSQAWQQGRGAWDTATESVPLVGSSLVELSRRIRQSVVSFAQPGQLFEDLGITYIGVMPGHDRPFLEETFRRALALKEPVIVHVRTQKGKGYKPAETDQVSFHGAALPPITVGPATDGHDRIGAANGAGAGMASSAADGSSLTASREADEGAPPSTSVLADRRSHPTLAAQPARPDEVDPQNTRKVPNYTAHFAAELVALAAEDRRIVGITAGMPTGTGLSKLQAAYPDRFIDVGIAEQHAVTLATGLALGGMRPVVALYSTFLQRAFDQTVHDVCQNDVSRAPRGGPRGTRRRGRHQPPGDVHHPGPADAAEPRDRQSPRRAGGAGRITARGTRPSQAESLPEHQEPSVPILDRLQDPAELRGLSEAELIQLAGLIRETMVGRWPRPAVTSAPRWVSSRSRSPCTGSWSHRATGSCGTRGTRPTPTSS